MFKAREASPRVRRRIFLAGVAATTALGLLGARLWVLQVLQGEHLAALSENNRIRLIRVPATRGRVVDRSHRVVIDSRASFDAVLVPEDAPDLESTVETLAHLLGQGSADTMAILQRAAGRPPFHEIVVGRDLDWEQVAAIETHRLELPGVSLRVTPRRSYPEAGILAHVLGYVGEVSQAEIESAPEGRYRQGDLIGKAGLEKVWESDLRGVNGGQQIEVDSIGRQVRVLDEIEPVPGNTLVLSIDLDLQRAAEQALGERAGAIVALDPRNGDVLAMASHPVFDPNRFARGIAASEWRALTEHPRHPLSARATQGQYPPGSTFKIVVAAAALEEGIINPFNRIYCAGHYRFGGRDFRCWKKGGHGSVNVHQALVQSCDVFFYQVGQRLGVDTIARYARALGLGAPTGVRLEGEKPGTIPDSQWKRERFSQPWYAGETLSVAIGQGYVTATPLQMAHLVGATATGVRYRPRLVQRVESPDGGTVRDFEPERIGDLPLRQTVLAEVREGLEGVVNAPGGTGRRAALTEVRVAGKTGTSQVVTLGRTRLKAHQVSWRQRDHAWFVAYAPADDPVVAVAALVEHADGGGGAVAAPIVNQVLQAYFRLREETEPVRYAQN